MIRKYYSILFIILFLGTGAVYGQAPYESKPFKKQLSRMEKKWVKGSDECKEGIVDAAKDFEEGKGKYFSFGDLGNWDMVYDQLFSDRLDVEVEVVGCVSLLSEECYNLFADFKLKEIHGKDVFKNLRTVTDSLYRR